MIPGGRGGVVASTSKGPVSYGNPRSVEHIHKLEQFVVKFFDEDGVAHTDVLVKIGEQYYANPSGEAWCAQLGPAQSWLTKQVHARILARESGLDPSTIPQMDTVNITGSGMAARIKDATETTIKEGDRR
jgi:hypothetical protein